jgi:adenine C2-methylase RlmN of 23S rRNA A2503 and tRNA A37
MKLYKSCFISYSHDSIKHKAWVKRLAQKLQRENIRVRLDDIDTHLGADLVSFMVDAITNSDRVLLICTENYYRKITGGAGFEKMLIGNELFKNPNTDKFIPILKDFDSDTSIPSIVGTKQHYRMKNDRILRRDIEVLAKAIKSGNTSGKRTITPPERKKKKNDVRSADTNGISRMKLDSYMLLGGRGSEGIRYLWKTQDKNYVESIAFNRRSNTPDISETDRKISAYTTSVSFGCELQVMGLPCSFCATGQRLNFKGSLKGEEIALQNIFMAEYDSDCPSWPKVRNNDREFAFMGQGEPGFCYAQIRKAIKLTDFAMEMLKQKVHRYIISTAGIPDMLDLIIEDFVKKTFKNRVTLHFSLHAVDDERASIMPIDRIYPYKTILTKTKEVVNACGEKVAIGVLLFDKFVPNRRKIAPFTTTKAYLDKLMNQLDPQFHRIDLCDVNRNIAIANQAELSNADATEMLKHVQNRGFESKLFSSFGADKSSGCGMLSSSKAKISKAGLEPMSHFETAIYVLKQAIAGV